MVYFYISTVFFIGGMIIIYWLHNQHHLEIIVEQAPHPGHAPLISVCIPARNEERNIRACVEAILDQDYPNVEVIMMRNFILILIGVLLLSACGAEKGIEIHSAWMRPAGQGENGAVYFVIHNHSSEVDELIGLSSDIAAAAEMHESKMSGMSCRWTGWSLFHWRLLPK